jgi:CRISPR/Cas system CSM-associated protein Csm2 small subunit
VPREWVFDSFYEGAHLCRGVYLETARSIAAGCAGEGLTVTAFRGLFFMVKSEEQRMKADPARDFGSAKEAVWRFARQVEYQVKRNVIKSAKFAAWVEKHVDVACRDVREFRGFVECLTSIVAYLKEK